MLFFASTQLINNVVNNTPGIKNRSSCMYEYLLCYRVAVVLLLCYQLLLFLYCKENSDDGIKICTPTHCREKREGYPSKRAYIEWGRGTQQQGLLPQCMLNAYLHQQDRLDQNCFSPHFLLRQKAILLTYDGYYIFYIKEC